MNINNFPEIVRILISMSFFLSIGRSFLNYQLMRFRWRQMFSILWFTYFSLNLTFNALMSIGLVVNYTQHDALRPLVLFDINWLFLLVIVSHLAMLIARFYDKRRIDRDIVLLTVRLIVMILLLPIPGRHLWTEQQYMYLFIFFVVNWDITGYYYIYYTIRYLSTHFTDYTKFQAFELFPHGIIVSDTQGKIISMNPSAINILSDVDRSDHRKVMQVLDAFDSKFRTRNNVYQINRQYITENNHHYDVWELIDITQQIDIQAEIDKSTAAIKGAWSLLKNIMEQLRKSVHHEEQVRLQQFLHDIMGENFSVIGYTLQMSEGRTITDQEKANLLGLLDSMQTSLEDRTAGGSDNSFRSLQHSFQRIGVKINISGDYPKSYHYRNVTYQILREAASNALKHGAANEISLTMNPSPTGFHFTISNNGQILSPPNQEGLGLTGMKRLVDDNHGTIEIDPNNQYQIDVTLPPCQL